MFKSEKLKESKLRLARELFNTVDWSVSIVDGDTLARSASRTNQSGSGISECPERFIAFILNAAASIQKENTRYNTQSSIDA
jgi:hypothetical protein